MIIGYGDLGLGLLDLVCFLLFGKMGKNMWWMWCELCKRVGRWVDIMICGVIVFFLIFYFLLRVVEGCKFLNCEGWFGNVVNLSDDFFFL